MDYRRLNSTIIPQQFPQQQLGDYTSKMSNCNYYGTSDAFQGFHQINLSEESREMTAFSTDEDHFEYTKVPQGNRDSSFAYVRSMIETLLGVPKDNYDYYIDDLVFFSKNWEEFTAIIEIVLQRLHAAGMTLAGSKTFLGMDSIKFLGFIISKEGVQSDNDKIKAITEFPEPTNKRQAKRWLGMTSWHRDLIPSYSKIAAPLRKLTLDKTKFIMCHKSKHAFIQLKQLMTSPAVMALPRLDQDYNLYADTSEWATGSILTQIHEGKEKVVGFGSRSLNKIQTKWNATERELLGLCMAMRKWSYLIRPRKVSLLMDHLALVGLCRKKNLSSKHFRYVVELMAFNIYIIFRRGVLLPHADCLSRSPHLYSCKDMINSPWATRDRFDNTVLNFLPRTEISEEEINEWRQKIATKCNFQIANEMENLTEQQNIKDGFYNIISLMLTKTTKYQKEIRNLVHQHEMKNRVLFRDCFINEDTDDRKHIMRILEDQEAEYAEYVACCGIFQIPIVVCFNNRGISKSRTLTAETYSDLKISPPIGLTLMINRLENGILRWINPSLTLPALSEKELRNESITFQKEKSTIKLSEIFGPERKEEVIICELTRGDEDDTILTIKDTADNAYSEPLFLMESEYENDISRCLSISTTPLHIPSISEVKQAQMTDAWTRAWRTYILTGIRGTITKKHLNEHKDQMMIDEEGILMYEDKKDNKLVSTNYRRVALAAMMIEYAFQSIHDSIGHPGFKKSLMLFRQRFFRPRAVTLLKAYCQNCIKCASKIGGPKQALPKLQKFQRADAMNSVIYLDFVGPFPETERGYRYLLSMLDEYSRWVHVTPLKDADTSSTISALLEGWISQYGFPREIKTDNGSVFCSALFRQLCKSAGIKKTFTCIYSPQNNLVERSHLFLKQCLKTLVNEMTNDWCRFIWCMLLLYRSTWHSSLNATPAFVLYGRELMLPSDLEATRHIEGMYSLGISQDQTAALVALRLRKTKEIIEKAKIKSQLNSHAIHNKKRKNYIYQEADKVLLRVVSNKKKISRKLYSMWQGPYTITKITSNVTVQLQCDKTAKIVHVHLNHVRSWDPTTHKKISEWGKQFNEIMGSSMEELDDEEDLLDDFKITFKRFGK